MLPGLPLQFARDKLFRKLERKNNRTTLPTILLTPSFRVICGKKYFKTKLLLGIDLKYESERIILFIFHSQKYWNQS